MKRIGRHACGLVLGTVLLAPLSPAHAGVMDFLFGSKKGAATAVKPDAHRRTWRIGEFTAIQLVARESGSAPNDQPVNLSPDGLRQQLAVVRTTVKGQPQPLFATDELNDLVEPLSQALSVAGPGDDVLLLSTSRRGESVFAAPLGLTARIFAQGGSLNVIVHDARLDFVNAYIGSHITPQFDFGTRARASGVTLETPSAATRRGDWLAIPIAAAAKPAVAPLAAPVAAPIPLQVAAPAAAPAPAPAAPAAARPRDAAFYEEQAQRLKGLKSLRDQGAITEDEYQQKRKEILSGL